MAWTGETRPPNETNRIRQFISLLQRIGKWISRKLLNCGERSLDAHMKCNIGLFCKPAKILSLSSRRDRYCGVDKGCWSGLHERQQYSDCLIVSIMHITEKVQLFIFPWELSHYTFSFSLAEFPQQFIVCCVNTCMYIYIKYKCNWHHLPH